MAHANLVIQVSNRGRRPCQVGSVPVVLFLGPDGRVVGKAVTSSQPGVPDNVQPRFTLGPGETASALLSGTDMPVGGATSCPSYARYAVEVWPGIRRVFAAPLEDCAGLAVSSLLPGFTGISPDGEVSGRAPGCPTVGAASGAGPFVEITARSGNVVVGGVTVVAQADGTEPFTITLAPGRYRIHSAPALSRSVAVRPGRITDIGLFGGCTQPPATVTTVPAAGGGSTTTTTTTLPPSEIAAAPRCTTAELDVSALKFGAGLGNVAEVLAFKNVGAELCTLTGYPGVAALDARGGQVAQARRSLTAMMGGQDTGTQPMTVPLEPGHVATATVDGSDNPVGTATSCVSYPALLVTVPAETRSTVLRGIGWQGPGFAAQGFPGCTPIVVTPVVPGDTGVYP